MATLPPPPPPDVSRSAQDEWRISKAGLRRWLARAAAIATLACLILYLSHPLWLTALANYLIVSSPPSRADALFVLGGGTGERELTGARLYREGWADEVFTSGTTLGLPGLDLTFAELSARQLERSGVPAERIHLLTTSDSTCDDARLSRQVLTAQSARVLLIVSDPFHLRRAQMIFEREYRGSGIAIIPVAASPSWFRTEKWWTREKDFRVVVEEYIKLIYYAVHGCPNVD